MAEPVSPALGVAYFGNRYPHHAGADLRAIAAGGASFVVHTMSEDDLRWNPGTISELVTIGRDVGLTAWLTPWGVAGVFGGEAASRAVGNHPAACQRDDAGRPLPALCLRRPAFRTVLEEWLDAAATGAEVVQWDEPHLALPHRAGTARRACRCEACLGAFRERFGEPMPTECDARVEAFLDDLVADTLAWLTDAAGERGLDSGVVLLADGAFRPVFWRGAARLPNVRFFGCTPYWLHYGVPAEQMPAYVRRWGRRVAGATEGTGATPLGWVQAFGVPRGREVEIERAIAELAEAGMGTIAVWSYLACAPMSSLAADDPDVAWKAVLHAFARPRGAGHAGG